jgi:Fe-S oxidoreductase
MWALPGTCPAHGTLNPKQLVLDLQHYLSESGPKLLGQAQKPVGQARRMVGDVIRPETLWACTTCYACVYECPVLIEQVDDIVDMRRYLALMEGDLPASLATTLTNIERSGNPWKQPRRKRAAWAQE